MSKKTIADNDDWSKFDHLLKRREIPAKTMLLREGEISKNAFIVEKGCLRTWFNNDGKDITTFFFSKATGFPLSKVSGQINPAFSTLKA
jgi:hypothetical protein